MRVKAIPFRRKRDYGWAWVWGAWVGVLDGGAVACVGWTIERLDIEVPRRGADRHTPRGGKGINIHNTYNPRSLPTKNFTTKDN